MPLLAKLLGNTISFGEIDACLISLEDRWLGTFRTLPTGEAGWYRRLGLVDRVGLVATAHAITALGKIRAGVPHLNEVVRTLLLHRRDEGGWPFVSNLNDTGVIDSTACVLLALHRWQNASELRDLDLSKIMRESLDWLEKAALPEGGWGIVEGSPYRNYSTALAIQALCICGRRSSDEVRRSLARMISLADPHTGGWYDANRRLSLPTTCEAIGALYTASGSPSRFAAEIAKACLWIIEIGNQTDLWAPSSETGCREEVEVIRNSQVTRIEYGHSTRPAAIIALSLAGYADRPETVAAAKLLLNDVTADRWQSVAGGHYSEPTSWMLYDVTTAFSNFREAFPKHADAVWYDHSRVVPYLRGQGAVNRMMTAHWLKFAVAIACVTIAVMLNRAGMVQGFGLTMLLFVLSTLALNIMANLITEFFRRRL